MTVGELLGKLAPQFVLKKEQLHLTEVANLTLDTEIFLDLSGGLTLTGEVTLTPLKSLAMRGDKLILKW